MLDLLFPALSPHPLACAAPTVGGERDLPDSGKCMISIILVLKILEERSFLSLRGSRIKI